MSSVAVIGAGAAGCFCAVNIKLQRPDVRVTVFEAGPKPMAKLALTGGGRCNITNSFSDVQDLRDVYPRGFNLMKRALNSFGPQDTVRWFEEKGVRLYTQPDGRMFPVSDDALEVVGALSSLMRKFGVEVLCRSRVEGISRDEDGFAILVRGGSGAGAVAKYDAVVVTSGGGTAGILSSLGVETVPEVPSLFTFRIEDPGIRSLMGSVAPEAVLGIAGTSFKAAGRLLLTDWGMSGPAVLRLSSYAARHLASVDWRAPLLVNWTGKGEEETRRWLGTAVRDCPARQIGNVHPESLSAGIWKHILTKAGIRVGARCSEIGQKGINRLVAAMTADGYEIAGKCSFKEEFVTCGGVSLAEVNPSTMESRRQSGLFFAGEVLDVDAVTGGFNLQAAWSTAYVASGKILLYL